MVQIFRTGEEQPNYLREISQKFGQGLSQGLSDQLRSYYDNKQRIEKGRPQARSMLRQTFKQYGADKGYTEDLRQKAEQYADQLVQQGYEPLEASDLAYRQMVGGFPDESGKPTVKIKPTQTKTQAALENLKSGAAAMGTLPVAFASQPFEFLSELGKLGRAGIGKLAGLSPEQMQEREAKLSSDIAAGEKATGIPNPLGGTSLSQAYRDITGGRSVAKTGTQRVLQQAALGPIGLVGGLAEEAARGLGVPEEYLPLANVTGLLSGGKLAAGLTGKVMDTIRKLPAFKTVSTAAKASGVPSQAIVEETASNLQGRGVDLTKVAEGDSAAVNEFNKELKKTAEIYKESERFHAKETLKRRAETAEKLKESPLEKYYAPKEEPGVRAQASEELRTAPLKERVKALEPEVQHAYRQLLSSENALRNARGKATEDVLARLKANVEMNRLNHSKMLNELRNTEFAIRNKKPPATTEEIGAQIEKSFAELREGIKEPTAEKLGKVREKLQKDKDVIEMAQKLVKRGEIPGPEVFDEYIKIHQQYNKAYGDLQKELSEFIKDNQIAAMKQQVDNARKLRDLVKEMQKAGEAKVVNQIDKRKAMRALDKPSGAFLRNMLKDLKKEIDAFQKQFFNVKNATHPGEAKVGKVAKEAIKTDIPAIAKDAANATKNPTTENIQKIVSETGLPAKDTKSFIEGLKADAKIGADKIKEGTATEADIHQMFKKIMDKYHKLPYFKKSLVGGVVLGTIQGIGEQYFGYKVSATQAGLAGAAIGSYGGKKGVGLGGAGVGAVAGIVFKQIRNFFENAEAEKLRSKRNSPEFNVYRKELEERYGKTKANRIMKKAMEQ